MKWTHLKKLHNVQRLDHKEIETKNRSQSSRRIKSVIKNLPAKRAQGQMASQGELYQTFFLLFFFFLLLFNYNCPSFPLLLSSALPTHPPTFNNPPHPPKSIPKTSRGDNTMEVIKLGENYPDDKPDKETTKKGKLQAKIHNEY